MKIALVIYSIFITSALLVAGCVVAYYWHDGAVILTNAEQQAIMAKFVSLRDFALSCATEINRLKPAL